MRDWPAFASTAVASFSLMIASAAPKPDPFQEELLAWTKAPRSRSQSKPMTVAVGSNSCVVLSITAAASWNRGAILSTVGISARCALRLSYT